MSHKNLSLSCFEFFELKNMITNSILTIYNSQSKKPSEFPISFPKEMERVLSNLDQLRPLILFTPLKKIENSDELKFMGESLAKKIYEDKLLHELFSAWKFSKFIQHSEIMLKYIFKFSSNHYFDCDLIPAHCRTNIRSHHFKRMFEITKEVLTQFKINDSRKILQDLSSLKHLICNEKTFYEQIGGAQFISQCLDHIYINLFGDPLTKNAFLNVDPEYVKYKQKIFFCRLFRNKIGSYDLDDLKVIHERLNISKEQFNVFVRSAQDYMGNIRLPMEQGSEIIHQLCSLEPYIVNLKH